MHGIVISFIIAHRMSILGKLLKREEVSSLIIIEDDFENRGLRLLKAISASLCARADAVDAVHAVLTENQYKEFQSGIPNAQDRLTVHDLHTDPLGWKSTTSPILDTNLHSLVTERVGGDNVAVVIDSLSNIILYRSAAYTCHVLSQFLQAKQRTGVNIVPVVCLIHTDLHDEHTLNLIRYVATTTIAMTRPRSHDYTGACKIVHRKTSGKILRSTEEFKLGSHFELEDARLFTAVDNNPHFPDENKAPDPTANLTFNLSLSGSEKQARSQLLLPYMKQHPRNEVPGNTGTEAKIFYQPDEADDFDEEDPDDDLDI